MPRQTDDSLLQFLVFIVIAVIVAIFNWMKNRGKEKEPDQWTYEPPERKPGPPQRPASVPPKRKTSWEDELRKLLEGEEATQPPVIPERPRPVVTVPPPQPVIITPVQKPQPRPQIIQEAEEKVAAHLAGFAESTQSIERAQHLDERVVQRLTRAGEGIRTHAAAQAPLKRSSHAAQILSLLQDPQSLRSVVVASTILGPPRGLDQ